MHVRYLAQHIAEVYDTYCEWTEQGPFNDADGAIRALRESSAGDKRLLEVRYIKTTDGYARRATLLWQGKRVPHWLGGHEQICETCSYYLSPGSAVEVVNLVGRVQPGETMPLGQCPRCGTLIYPEAA